MKKTLLIAGLLAFITVPAIAADTSTTKNIKTPCKCEKPCNCAPSCACKRTKSPQNNMKAKFENRLQLTDKQKEQAKQIRLKGHDEMKPVVDELNNKNQAKKELIKQKESSDSELIKINDEIKTLKKQRREVHQKSMHEFEKILTQSQKKELEKMKQEGREKFEQSHKRHHRPDCDCGKCSSSFKK